MITLDARRADCRVIIFREGFLSSLGFDIEFAVTRFGVVIDPEARSVEANFDAESLRVVRAFRDSREASGTLGPDERRSIEEKVSREVLECHRFPEIRFRSRLVADAHGGYDVTGVLALRGREREVPVSLRPNGGRLTAEVRVNQLDFGIVPYRALMGTLRVKPELLVRLSLPAQPPTG